MNLISTRHRPWVVYAAFTLLSLGVMTSNLRGGGIADRLEVMVLYALAPVYTTVDWILDNSVSLWNNYINLTGVQQENIELKSAVQILREEHLLLEDRAQSAERLEELIERTSSFPVVHRRANVIRRGDTLLNPIILIDMGSNQGIREGMGVASSDGAIGQVVRVGPSISKVLTLHHPDAGIGAMLQKSRVQGVVSGSGKGNCSMRFVSRFDPVTLGEMVVTSGLDGAFPKGIPIGRVSAIERDNNEIFQTLEIITEANLNTLEELIVFFIPELPPFERPAELDGMDVPSDGSDETRESMDRRTGVLE
ncbi:rod shape-determining protein MreC [bacterium]|nr:rod shape-determining protein MreC [candidate division CSSED10-310 bacterium]